MLICRQVDDLAIGCVNADAICNLVRLICTDDGIDLRDLSNADLRRAVVMVTQEAYLFSGTVIENMRIGKPDATLAEIVAAITRG
jgi:ABC-type multidrug transport system fused ATPase/permease subunit